MLLKSATILRCSEPIASSGIRASKEIKDLEERISILQNEKLALEEAKQKLTSDLVSRRRRLD